MPLPAALLDAFFPLYLLQWGIVLFDMLLRMIVASRWSWAALHRALAQQRIPPSPYWVLLGCTLLATFVVGLILWALNAPAAAYVYFTLGQMLVLSVAPLWWFHGLLRYYACAQGLGLTIGVCVWPALVSRPYRLWFMLGSFLCYTLLFVVTAQWRQCSARPGS
jgi:hypothetical protein